MTLLEFQVLFFVFAATLLFSVALVVIAVYALLHQECNCSIWLPSPNFYGCYVLPDSVVECLQVIRVGLLVKQCFGKTFLCNSIGALKLM